MHFLLTILLSVFLCGPTLHVLTVRAFEENSRFCIHTQPIYLTDLDKHVNPKADDPNCEILATTLTTKERESFLDTLCKDHGSTHKDDYHYFRLRNGEFKGVRSYHDICDGKTNPMLAWIPYQMMQHNYAQELNPKERRLYIAKATDVEREKTELCHFRQFDIVSNLSGDLFTCIVMIFEDNFYGLEHNINVLVDLEPIMYEIRNVTYLPWVNVTASYKTLLGKSVLKNPNREQKQIYGSIDFAYVEQFKVNLSSVYTKDMKKLPLAFEHNNDVVELNGKGHAALNVKEQAYFGRVMPPKSDVKVNVIGQWAEQRRKFSAQVYEYYGYGIKRFLHEIHNCFVSFMRIDSTEPVFEMPELLMTTTQSKKRPKKFQRLTLVENDTMSDDDNVDLSDDAEWTDVFGENPEEGHPYPEFYPWGIAGALLVGGALLLAVVCMVRSYSKDRQKHQYELAAGGATVARGTQGAA